MTSIMLNLDHKVSSPKSAVEPNTNKLINEIAEATLMSPQKKQDLLVEGMSHQFDSKGNLISLWVILLKVLKSASIRSHDVVPITEPDAQPMVCISKWADYSNKYGFGYQLSDESVGVLFNDSTKLIMLPNGTNVHYIDENGAESSMTVDNYPSQYDKKMKILSYFSRYMQENLCKTGPSVVKETDSMSKVRHLHLWCRSTMGVLMQLNNGTVQMNFKDHTKIVMCPLVGTITYVDEDKLFRTYKFVSLQMGGCPIGLYEKMLDVCDKITMLLEFENALLFSTS